MPCNASYQVATISWGRLGACWSLISASGQASTFFKRRPFGHSLYLQSAEHATTVAVLSLFADGTSDSHRYCTYAEHHHRILVDSSCRRQTSSHNSQDTLTMLLAGMATPYSPLTCNLGMSHMTRVQRPITLRIGHLM